MKNRKPFVMDKEMLELTDKVRKVILKEEKRYTIKEFTKAELNHLLYLIEANEREGWYWGNEKHYWKRSSLLKEKLKNIKN